MTANKLKMFYALLKSLGYIDVQTKVCFKMIWKMKHFVILFVLRLQRHRILDFKVTWETSVGYATNC